MPAGRPRKTPQELELSGTNIYHPERKKWNRRNSTPLTEKPAPGKYLKRTQFFWNQFMLEKATQNVLSIADEPVFTAMFDAYDRWLRYMDRRDELDGTVGWTDLNDIKLRNQLDIMIDREFKQWTSLAIRFGLTPTERSKLAVPQEDPEDEIFRIIGDK